jgi:hypothetical protein
VIPAAENLHRSRHYRSHNQAGFIELAKIGQLAGIATGLSTTVPTRSGHCEEKDDLDGDQSAPSPLNNWAPVYPEQNGGLEA